ncbi:MAG TPA: serine hydrolase domain-containing protein [Bacillota bacterium]|nr:serine hydrolase domain-containing protein [Bacillota bacterium]
MLRARFSLWILRFSLLLRCSPALALEPSDFNFPGLFRTPPQESINPADLETFLDDFFAREMERLQIPGAVFALVENGEIVITRGYGYADLESQVRADPEKSLFRVASISKLFTATAAMQLYEQGRLDLMEDVNTYLDEFQLETKFAPPVTMHHLLTHTAGFDDRSVNLAFETEDELPSLEEYLAANMPPRVRPPGEVISYSNHGLALAGLVVEKISGQPFIDYVHQHILEPLGMERSSFLLPPDLAPDLATGYFFSAGINQPRNFDYLYNIAPAASLNATAADMARFAIAHLQEGAINGSRILKAQTAQKMQSQQFAHHDQLDGVCYGFFEEYINDRRFIHHSGLWGGFASLLFLYPEGNLGFFVSFNSDAGTEAHSNLAAAFADAFLPAEDETPETEDQENREGQENENDVEEENEEEVAAMTAGEGYASRAGACLGCYRPVRYSRHSLEKIKILTAQCRAADPGEGKLALQFSAAGQKPLHWTEAEPFLFRNEDSGADLAFRRNEQGRVTYLFIGPLAMERVAWYEEAAYHRAAAIAFLALFTSAWAGWPLLWAYRQRRKGLAGQGRGRRIAAAATLLNTVFMVGYYHYITTRPNAFFYGVPPAVVALLILPLIAAALAAGAAWMAARAWQKGFWSLAGRIHYSLVSLALILFIPFLHYWNLLGFRF